MVRSFQLLVAVATLSFVSLVISSGALLASDIQTPVTLVKHTAQPAPAICAALRPGDEVYEVSSRCLPNLPQCTTMSPVAFQISKLEFDGWRVISSEEFDAYLAAAPQLRTVVYAHGNWMEYNNARNRGTYVYKRLSERATEPIRTILYSWPSQRDGRPVKDVREKADRADMETFYFSDLLARIPQESPLGLLSFSFGGRVVCGGLHIANGGQLEGRQSVRPLVSREEVRVSLIAPAFDRTWLAANRPYSMALNNVASLINVYNSRDPVLRRFRFIDVVSSQIAAGFSGLSDPRATQPLQSDARFRQYDCSSAVGSSHDEMTYYRECCHYNIAIDNVLGK